MGIVRRILKWASVVIGTVLLLVIVAVGGILIAANTDSGRATLARIVASVTAGMVRISGLSGAFPAAPRIAAIEVSDADGTWLRIENLELDWSPGQLLSRKLSIAALRATRVAMQRLPKTAAAAPDAKPSTGTISLPVKVHLDVLQVARLEISQPVAGFAGVFALDGTADVPTLETAAARVTLKRLDGEGLYRLDVHQDSAGMHAILAVSEPETGLVSGLSGLPGPIQLNVAIDGPPASLATRLEAQAGALSLSAQGTVDITDSRADLNVAIPDLGPFAALGGLDLGGDTRLRLRPDWSQAAILLNADGTLGLTRGLAPLPELIGPKATLGLTATVNGANIQISRFDLAGHAVTASAKGGIADKVIGADWTLGLPDLAVLRPTLQGELNLSGHVAGPQENLALRADLNGHVAAPEIPGDARSVGDFMAHIDANGLPASPSGHITATGELAGAPIRLDITGARRDNALHVEIAGADWRSLHAQGIFDLPPGATIPLGRLDLKVGRLADVRPFTGLDLAGAIAATLDSQPNGARLTAEVQNAAAAGASVGSARLEATIPDPVHPVANLKLLAQTLRAPGVADPIAIDTTAQLDVTAKTAEIHTLVVSWKNEKLRLLNPARIAFGDTRRVDRLRLGLGTATLALDGQIQPTLDLTAQLRGVTPDLAAPFMPGLAIDGRLQADARLTGEPTHPSGTLRVEADGLHARTGPARSLPPARIAANAVLDGRIARLDTQLTAGTARLAVTGTAPLDPTGAFDLGVEGAANLTLLEPLIAAGGRRVRGNLALDGTLRGTRANPQIGGVLRITDGSVRDYTTGVALTDIAATIRAAGDTLRIETLSAHAGPGTIDITGSIGALAPTIPIDITLTARGARPIVSDRLTAAIDADLTLRGQATDATNLAGKITINTAEIRIPERLPASIPVLNIRNAPTPGATSPHTPASAPTAYFAPANIHLDLTLDAPSQIFLRGRGIDAELGGRVHIAGTAANPIPDGAFKIRRGQFSIAGQTLSFTHGTVGFDGGALTDPSLDFLISRTSSGVTANLAIGGFASNPKITLSSTPDQPQDEVLSHLLLGKSSAALGPLELAQIAATLASLTGVAPGIGDPLNNVRSRLGLDRLSISNSSGTSTLEAGRNISPNLYVGVRKSLSTDGAQAVVQYDIGRGIKLEGTVGTGAASATGADTSQGTGVGVIYEHDY